MATPDEIIDIYDENRRRIGRLSRLEAHRTGAWHACFHCWIVRPGNGGTLLWQRRAPDKLLFPNLLDVSVGGHYLSGETTADGLRELEEELGVRVAFDALVPLGVKIDLANQNGIVNREFCDVFLLVRDQAPADYPLNRVEVAGLEEIGIDDGLRLFFGETDTIAARGVLWNAETKRWEMITHEVDTGDFVPRLDSYYRTILIMAQRMLRGERRLSV